VTPKPIVYSAHARVRLRERHVTREHVRWLIARGRRAPATTIAGAQRWSCRGCPDGRREAEVVFIEDAEQITIVTAYWIS
jgi:hypothetical protein